MNRAQLVRLGDDGRARSPWPTTHSSTPARSRSGASPASVISRVRASRVAHDRQVLGDRVAPALDAQLTPEVLLVVPDVGDGERRVRPAQRGQRSLELRRARSHSARRSGDRDVAAIGDLRRRSGPALPTPSTFPALISVDDARPGGRRRRGRTTPEVAATASRGAVVVEVADELADPLPAGPVDQSDVRHAPNVPEPRQTVPGGASLRRTLPPMTENMKPRSHEVTDGMERAPARAMLRAVGMTDADWGKAQVGVASSWNEVTPCNMPLDRLAKRAKEGVRDAGGFPLEFVTIAVSDGISMGHEGMRGSLVSREIIADSVECVMHAERLDALVDVRRAATRACPACSWPSARLNLPSVFLYGGSILPGRYKDQALDIVSVFEAVGACAAGTITRERARRDREAGVPDRGIVRGHVHREHDGVGRRGDRDVAARQRVAAGGRPPPRRLRVRERPRGDAPARARASGRARS